MDVTWMYDETEMLDSMYRNDTYFSAGTVKGVKVWKWMSFYSKWSGTEMLENDGRGNKHMCLGSN